MSEAEILEKLRANFNSVLKLSTETKPRQSIQFSLAKFEAALESLEALQAEITLPSNEFESERQKSLKQYSLRKLLPPLTVNLLAFIMALEIEGIKIPAEISKVLQGINLTFRKSADENSSILNTGY